MVSDTLLKGDHQSIIPAKLSLIWFCGFRAEDLNVKVYNVGRVTDGSDSKSSYSIWPDELKTHTNIF
jgi:hypothetical protein